VLRLLFALLLAPLALGLVVVTYRDAGVTHWPARIAAAEQLREGRIPLVNPYASCGEPLAGNPNFGVFFPDTLLGLVVPAAAAFGARGDGACIGACSFGQVQRLDLRGLDGLVRRAFLAQHAGDGLVCRRDGGWGGRIGCHVAQTSRAAVRGSATRQGKWRHTSRR